MGYWPDVNPGDTFQPNAKLENEVRHRLNEINGFLSGTITAGKTTSSLCIKGYNPTSDETIAAGDVVIIPEGPIVEDAFPVATMIDGEYHMLVDSWGIAQEEIGPKGIGSILIMGAAIVPIISETGTDTFDFVKPVGGGGSFKKAKSGIAKYLRPIGTNHALIFVGISSGLVYEQGKGVKITNGTYGVPPVISSEITSGTDIDVSGGTDGQPYVISYTGSGGGGGGGGIGFPDYLALNKLPSGLPAPSESVQGIGSTYLLPVPAGKSIKYYSPLQYCVALFAVADGWDGTPQVLTNDTAYTTPAAGWVRISILDDGQHQNGCLRFYVGTNDWTKALPLYRCGTFRAGATGISSTFSGDTATISLTGGTGSVKIKSGNNVSISGQTNGVIEISATGGGGGGDENVEYVWFGSVPPANLDDWIIEAEPNKTYNLYEEYVNSSSFRDYVYTSQWIQGTYGIDADDGGNILVKLPTNLSAPCMIKIYAWRDSMIVVIAPDGRHIIDDTGTNTDSSEGFSGGCLHVYVYQPNNSTYGTGAWRSQHHS
jgi:hypothetical protein